MNKNFVLDAKTEVEALIRDAFAAAEAQGKLQGGQPLPAFTVEIPADSSHGDFATNAAMVSAKTFRSAPVKIAGALVECMDFSKARYIDRAEIAGPGFINFFVSPVWFADIVAGVLEAGDDYGRSDYGKGEKVMVEFVSANPTGPMHMGNARGGAIGDCLAAAMDACGYDVTREFYINDAGNQIEKFGLSLEARYLQIFKGEEAVPFPEDGYHGEDIKERAQQYKEQAMQELSALGVTFPISADYYISASNQTALDSANVLKQVFSNSLGDDYVKLNIKTYVSSSRQEVYTPRLHSIVQTGWGADYGDPQNYLGQMTYGNETAYFPNSYNYVNEVEVNENTQALIDVFKTLSDLVNEADQIHDDLDARYKAYAKAEAYLIEHAIVVPTYYDVGWCLSKINLYTQRNAMFGCQNGKMKNWETAADGYTTEEMNSLKEAFLAE